MGVDVFFIQYFGIVVTIQPKKRIARAFIFGVFVYKLNY